MLTHTSRNAPQIPMAAVEVKYTGQGVKDVPANDFINAVSAYLKSTGKVQLPSYVDYCKTGSFKELGPQDEDWYYVKAAAVARRVYTKSGVGVGHLRRAFGGRNGKNSTCTEHHARAAGGVIRHAMHTLEDLGIIEKIPGGKGRRITPEGQRQMDLVAARVEGTRFHVIETADE